MSADVSILRSPHFVEPDQRRTVIRNFVPGNSPNALQRGQTWAERVVGRIFGLPENKLAAEYARLLSVFDTEIARATRLPQPIDDRRRVAAALSEGSTGTTT